MDRPSIDLVEGTLPPELLAVSLLGPDGEPLGFFRLMAHTPRVLTAMARLGGTVARSIGDDRLREIVVLRTVWRADCDYELGAHRHSAAGAGLSAAEIDALTSADPMADDVAEDVRVLAAMVDELHAAAEVSPATWAAVLATWPAATCLDLVVLAGFYRLISGLANSTGLPPDAST